MQYDALIIGGSFAGLSAAMQLARANRAVCVVDGGEPRNRFAAASHGFFGQDGMPPRQMLAQARAKLAAYPSVRFVEGQAANAAAEASGYAVTLADGGQLAARKLILAFGLKDGLPDIPGLTERWGDTVNHCPYCHGYEFLHRPLGVISSHVHSAMQAQLLADWGPTTFFLNGGDRPDAETAARLAARNVTIEPERIVALEGEAPSLAGIRLANERFVELAALFVAPRTSFQCAIAEQLGCALEDGPMGRVIQTDAMKQTSVPGVYAAGDIARPMHNATFASADGVMAGVGVHHALIFGAG